MSADDTDDERDEDPLAPEPDEGDPLAPATDDGETDGPSARERIEENADRAVESFDEGVIDLLSWLLDTETRARIYVYLRGHPDSTSKEVAKGTGLYPSTVREALAELHEDGTVTRHKRQSDGAGNNPYEYAAIPPSDLVGNVVEQIQGELNAVFNLDRRLDEDDDSEGGTDPVTITVREEGDADG
jgi:predicted transcriptional regulator